MSLASRLIEKSQRDGLWPVSWEIPTEDSSLDDTVLVEPIQSQTGDPIIEIPTREPERQLFDPEELEEIPDDLMDEHRIDRLAEDLKSFTAVPKIEKSPLERQVDVLYARLNPNRPDESEAKLVYDTVAAKLGEILDFYIRQHQVSDEQGVAIATRKRVPGLHSENALIDWRALEIQMVAKTDLNSPTDAAALESTQARFDKLFNSEKYRTIRSQFETEEHIRKPGRSYKYWDKLATGLPNSKKRRASTDS